MPQHAAQIAAIKHLLLRDGWVFSSYFDLNFFTPYLLGYSVALLLSAVVGIPLALKLVAGAALAAFPLAGRALVRAAGGDTRWCWLLLPVPFGLAYQWGFFNFLVAAPLGLLFLRSVLKHSRVPSRHGAIRIVIWLHVLFVAHVLTAAFFSACALLILSGYAGSLRDRLLRTVPVLCILPVALIWLAMNIGNEPSAENQFIWAFGLHRFWALLPTLASAPQTIVGQFVGVGFLLVPLLLGAQPRRGVAAWGAFGLYVAWMCFVPHLLGGTSFIYERFGIFGMPLYLLAFAPAGEGAAEARPASRWVEPGAALVALLLVAMQVFRAWTFAADTAGYDQVMRQAKPEGRILMLSFNPGSLASDAPVALHFSGWYQAQQQGLSEFSFSTFWGVPASFKKDAPVVIKQGFEWRPWDFSWDEHGGHLYDYVLVRHPADASDWMAERTSWRMGLVARNGEWQLYERVGDKNDGQ